jgi:hypothetical protein
MNLGLLIALHQDNKNRGVNSSLFWRAALILFTTVDSRLGWFLSPEGKES